MKKRISFFLTALLLLPLVLVGCGSTGGGTTVVRLNEVTHSVFYAPQYVAMSQGFFAEEGLEIQLTNGGGADKVMTAVVSGQSDIGLAGPESCIYVYNQGKEDYPMIFAQLTQRDGAFIVGRTDEDFSWENLRGKTILGGRKGGVPEMTLEYVMAQNGVIPHVDAVVDTSVQFNMMAGAFTGGMGDYVALFEPTATEVEQAGQGYILCSIGQESGDIPYTAYFATQSYMAENPDIIQGFTNAVYKAQQWIASHSDREVAEAIAHQFPDTSLDLLETVTARHRRINAWNTTLVMEESSLERLETVMEHAGELSREEWVIFDELVDNRFALAAAQ
ncbi:MAG: ABC transporter substrate-binding protein [Oscillospiraceae bacterium]|nr:ABC transporter substrate-binding protein [Oscillospiraceae bacterium]